MIAILVALANERQRGIRYNVDGLRLLIATFLLVFPSIAAAQDAPPGIGPFALDVHVTVPQFPDEPQLAESRTVSQAELPGSGFGLHAGAHVYVFSWKAVTVGVGGAVTLARAHSGEQALTSTMVTRAVTERFTHVAPELSFNFGNGNGWSYISGGIGPSTWSIVADGEAPTSADAERLYTINYGGGARWFAKPRLAFSFDVRFYAINPGTPQGARAGSPRTTLLIVGAGVSVK